MKIIKSSCWIFGLFCIVGSIYGPLYNPYIASADAFCVKYGMSIFGMNAGIVSLFMPFLIKKGLFGGQNKYSGAKSVVVLQSLTLPGWISFFCFGFQVIEKNSIRILTYLLLSILLYNYLVSLYTVLKDKPTEE